MNRSLPPLIALRAFEAAARHLSFSQGAAELRVTTGAVSLQIKALEQTLGVRLFERRPRAVTLTPEGLRYFRATRSAFRLLEDATREVARGGQPVTLVVSCTTGFAVQWLVPRLPGFHALWPRIDVRISANQRLVDFAQDAVDFAVRHGLGRYPGLKSERLLDDDLVPVCSPQLLSTDAPLAAPDDLARHTLLHDEHRDDWRLWLEAAGATQVDAGLGPIFTDSNGALQAALLGKGVALVRESLVPSELAQGRLVKPLSQRLKVDLAYHVVYPSWSLHRPEARAFRDWILREAAGEDS